MDTMLHVTPSCTSLPDGFSIPADQLHPATTSNVVTLPVIDLSGSRDDVCHAILQAGKEFGFFQVVNHRICEETLREMEAVCDEFFELPVEDKMHLYSDDKSKPNRLFSGSNYKTSSKMYWIDCLRLTHTIPTGDSKNNWPNKPQRLREVFENFIEQTRVLGMELLRMLCKSLGLPLGYFDGDLSGGDMVLGVNLYPPCPEPSRMLGLPPHCDRNLLTLVLSGAVQGMEVFYNGDWIKVEPMPNAFIVNFGLQIEVVANGILKSVEHRVVTNMSLARTSVVTTINATNDCLLGPAEELLSDSNPPRYRTIMCRDFVRIYTEWLEQCEGDMKHHMKPFKI
ncbi:hypothetical protein HU200_060809 [Digitaria exilis]|uniref:Fe2OG dioxygenase domain-containing protein n=1 Tax=Digitaria exilis TaxID=1010633 RepID=A0A835AFZ2_9POAL|nr:hypothetical protein HU200_060809 [Digitaria exilis]